MKTAEAPQDCVERAYFIVEYLILKCYKSNSRCVFRYVERREMPDVSFDSVQPFPTSWDTAASEPKFQLKQ